MSYQAYQKAQQSSESPSQVEYRLFAQVTNSLIEARDKNFKGADLAKALDWNRRMWSVLSSDCGAEGNALPPNLRAGIISLSIWVSKHSSAVMRGQEPIDDLININRTIMEGLADQARLQAKAAASAPAPANPGSINSSL
ncbi:flagellar biosynthesis regulator FlaF [Kordiimonas gwangyangensis]|uniref:flagellar biosynthesis regulator FlaF n=1 Tax=Kordiimonas gwangyangensis TaxID=288022 RepID=UPI000360FE06|nr:flagellar biosynthesis regulator FlaF [Kordiimonas gwangyangensis]